MSIETTINTTKDIAEELLNASIKAGVSQSYIIVTLLKRAMGDSYRLTRSFSPVKYQKRNPLEIWHKLHIQLNEYEYEYCLDMRKLFKMSVSLIVSYAVKRYLKEILNKLFDTNKRKITDNYPPNNYILIREVVDSVICWRIYWGLPYNFIKKCSFM